VNARGRRRPAPRLHPEPVPPDRLAVRAAAALAGVTGLERHDVAVVLGSGWSPAAHGIGELRVEVPFAEVPGFVPAAVPGQLGVVRSVRCGGVNVLCFLGRLHAYEGHPLDRVVHGVRTAAAAGCGTIVLTNASGGLRQGLQPGQAVLISDHLNLTGRSPLIGPRFVDLTDLYSPRLRRAARDVDPSLEEGVYAAMPGPSYETPAEVRMLRALGADLVGMSTVHEAIAARAEGMEVLGLSLVTNLAAGLSGEKVSHQEVVAAGAAASERMGSLLARVLGSL
jgi:purine-nucleoside phosphorylase